MSAFALEREIEKPRCRPVIVLGVERSGTSLVTEMVHRWGAHAGESDMLYPGDERNPTGFWEYKPLWKFMGEMCRAAEMSWWDAAYSPPIAETNSLDACRDKARELVKEMEKQGRAWVWKYPDLTFFMPFWKEIWGEATYIITVRNPYDSARSWQKFVMGEQLKPSLSFIAGNLLRWQLRMSSILEQTNNENRLIISYERLVRGPHSETKRLYDFLNRVNANSEPSEATIKYMAQAVKETFWRNRSEGPFEEVQEATKEQQALHSFLQKSARDLPVEFEPERWLIPVGSLSLAKNQELFAEYYNLSNRLLDFFPVQAVLATLRPRDFLIYTAEMEKYLKVFSGSRRSLKTLAGLFLYVSRARCYLQEVYRRRLGLKSQ